MIYMSTHYTDFYGLLVLTAFVLVSDFYNYQNAGPGVRCIVWRS